MPADIEDNDDVRRELDVRVGLGLLASEDQISELLAIAREVELAPGATLHRHGEPATKLFQLASGEIELVAPNAPVWRLVDTGTLGFVDHMLSRAYARTAVATTACRLLEIDAADYAEYLEDHFEVCYRVMSELSREIINDLCESQDPNSALGNANISSQRRSLAEVEMAVVDRVILLSQMSAFAGASMHALANLAQSATEARFEPGDIIAVTGSRPSLVSVLVQGTVELVLPSGDRVIRAQRDFVGHVEELVSSPRLISALAKTSAMVLQIEREELLDRMEEHFDLAMTIFAFIARERDRLNNEKAGAVGDSAWTTSGSTL